MGDREEKVKLGRLKLKKFQNKKKIKVVKEKLLTNESLSPPTPDETAGLENSFFGEGLNQYDSLKESSANDSLPSSNDSSSLEQWSELIAEDDQEYCIDKKPAILPAIDFLKNKIKDYEKALEQRDDVIDKMRVRIVELHKEQQDSRSDSHKIEQDIMSVIKPQLQQLIVDQQNNKPQNRHNEEEDCSHCIHYKLLEDELGLLHSKNSQALKEKYDYADNILSYKRDISNLTKQTEQLSQTNSMLLNIKNDVEVKLSDIQERHKIEKEAFEQETRKLTDQLEVYFKELERIKSCEVQPALTKSFDLETESVLEANKELTLSNQQLEQDNYKRQQLLDEFILKVDVLEKENLNLSRSRDNELQEDVSLLLREKEDLKKQLNEAETKLEQTNLNYNLKQDEVAFISEQLLRTTEAHKQESLSCQELQKHYDNVVVESKEKASVYSLLLNEKNNLELKLMEVEQELKAIQANYNLKQEELAHTCEQLNQNNLILGQSKLEMDFLRHQLEDKTTEELSLINNMFFNYKKELELNIEMFEKECKDISMECEVTQNKLAQRLSKTDSELVVSNKKLQYSENELLKIIEDCKLKQGDMLNMNKQLINCKRQLEQANSTLSQHSKELTIEIENVHQQNFNLTCTTTELEQKILEANSELEAVIHQKRSSEDELEKRIFYMQQELKENQSNYKVSQEELVSTNEQLLQIKTLESHIERIERELKENRVTFKNKEKELLAQNRQLHTATHNLELKLEHANEMFTDGNINNNVIVNEKFISYSIYVVNSLVEDLKLFLSSKKMLLNQSNICDADRIAKEFHNSQIASIYLNNFSKNTQVPAIGKQDLEIYFSPTIQVIDFVVEKCQEILKNEVMDGKRNDSSTLIGYDSSTLIGDDSSTLIESMEKQDSLLEVGASNQSSMQEDNQELEAKQNPMAIFRKSWLDKSEITDDSCNLEPAQAQFLLSELVETFVQINQEVIRHLNQRGSEKQNVQLLPHYDEDSFMQSFNTSCEAPENYSLEYTEDGFDLTPNSWLSLQPIMEEDVVLGVTKTLKANFSALSHKLDSSRSDDYKLYMKQLEAQSEEQRKEMLAKNQALEAFQCQIKQLENENRKLEDQASNFSHDLQRLLKEKTNLEEDKVTLVEKIQCLENQNQLLTHNSSDSLQELLKENTDLRNEKNSREHHFIKETQHLQAKIQQLELDIAAIIKEKEQLLELKREEIEDLNNKVEAQDKQIKCSNKFINDQTQERELEREEHSKVKDEYEKLCKEKEKFLSQSTDFQKETKNLEFKLMAKVKKIKRITLEHEETNKELAQQKDRIKDLEDIIQTLDLDLQQKCRRLDQLEAEKSEYLEIFENLEAKVKEEPCGLDKANASALNSDLIKQIELLKDQVNNLREDSHLKSTFEFIINEFETQLHALEERIDAHCRLEPSDNPSDEHLNNDLPQEENRILSPVSQYSENIHRINLKLEKIFKLHSVSVSKCQKLSKAIQEQEASTQCLAAENQTKVNSLQETTQNLESVIQDQSEKVNSLQEVAQVLETRIQDQAEQHQTKVISLQEEVQILEKTLQDQTERHQSKAISLKEEAQTLETILQEHTVQHQTKVNSLQEEVQILETTIQDQTAQHQTKVNSLQEEVQTLEATIQNQSAHVYSLEKEHASERYLEKQKRSQLKEKLDILSKENNSNAAQLSDLQNELKALKEEFSLQTENLQQLANEKCQIHETLLESLKEYNDLEESNKILEKPIEKEPETSCDISQTTENSDKPESSPNETVNSPITLDIKTALTSLTQECQELRKALNKSKEDNDIQKHHYIDQISFLEQESALLKSELEEKLTEIEKERQTTSELLEQIEQVSNENRLSCNNITELKEELKSLNHELIIQDERLCQVTMDKYRLEQELSDCLDKAKEIQDYNFELEQEKSRYVLDKKNVDDELNITENKRNLIEESSRSNNDAAESFHDNLLVQLNEIENLVDAHTATEILQCKLSLVEGKYPSQDLEDENDPKITKKLEAIFDMHLTSVEECKILKKTNENILKMLIDVNTQLQSLHTTSDSSTYLKEIIIRVELDQPNSNLSQKDIEQVAKEFEAQIILHSECVENALSEKNKFQEEHELEKQFFKVQISQYLQENDILKIQLEKLKDMESVKNTNPDLQTKLDTVSKENEYNLSNVSKLQKELASLNQQLDQQAKSLETIFEGKHKLQEDLRKQHILLDEFQKINHDLGLQLNSAQLVTVREYPTIICDVEQQTQQKDPHHLETLLDDNRFNSGQLSELQVELENLKKQLGIQNEILQLASNDNGQLRHDLAEQLELIKESQECNESLKAQLSELNEVQVIGKGEQQIADLKQQVTDAIEENRVNCCHIAKFQMLLERQNDLIAEKEHQNDVDKTEQQRQLTELESEVEHLKGANQALNVEYQSKLSEQLSKEMELIKENELGKISNLKLSDKLETILKEAALNASNLFPFQNELSSLRQQLHLLTDNLKQATEEKGKLEQDLIAQEKILKHLEEFNQSLKEELEINSSKISNLGKDCEDLNKSETNLYLETQIPNDEHLQENAVLKAQLKELQSSTVPLSTLKDLQEEIEKERQKYTQLQKEFENISKEDQNYLEKVIHLQKELELQGRYHDIYVQKTTEEFDKLDHELSQHQKKLKNLQGIEKTINSEYSRLYERMNIDLNTLSGALVSKENCNSNRVQNNNHLIDDQKHFYLEAKYEALVKEFVVKLHLIEENIDKLSTNLKTLNDSQTEELFIEEGPNSDAFKFCVTLYRINSKFQKISDLQIASVQDPQKMQKMNSGIAKGHETGIMKYQQENVALQLKLQEYKTLLEDSYQVFENHKEEVQLLEWQVSQYTQENTNLKGILEELKKSSQDSVEKLTLQTEFEQQKKAQLILKLELVSKELDIKSEQLVRLEEELKEKEVSIIPPPHDMDRTSKEKGLLKRGKHQYAAKDLKLINQATETDGKLNNSSQLVEKDNSKDKELEENIAQLHLQLEDATRSIDLKTMQLTEYQNELAKLKLVQAENMQQYFSERNALQQELTRLENKLKESQQSYTLETENLQNRIKQLAKIKKDQTLQLKLAEENVESKSKSLEFVSEEKDKFSALSDQLQKEVEILEEQLKVQVGEIQRIVKENEKLGEDLTRNISSNQGLQDTIVRLQNELQTQLGTQAEGHEQDNDLKIEELQKLNDENVALQVRIERTEIEIEDLEIKLQFLTDEKVEALVENEIFKEQILHLKSLVKDLEKVVETQEAELDLKTQSLNIIDQDIQETLAMKIADHHKFLSGLTELTDENDRLYTIILDLQKQSNELRQIAESKNEEVEMLSTENISLVQDLASCKGKIKELQRETLELEGSWKQKIASLCLEKAPLENKILSVTKELEKARKDVKDHHHLVDEYKEHLETLSEQHANTQQAYRTQVIELENKEYCLQEELKRLEKLQISEKENYISEVATLKLKLTKERLAMEQKFCDYKISKDNDTQKQIEEIKTTFRRPIEYNNSVSSASSRKLEKKVMRRTLKNVIQELLPGGCSVEFEELLDTAIQIEKEPPESAMNYSKESLFSLFKSCTDKLINHYLVRLNICNQTNLSLLPENRILNLQAKYHRAVHDIEEEQSIQTKLQQQKLEQQEKRFKMELASKNEEIETLLNTIAHNSSSDTSYEVLVNKLPENVKYGMKSVDSMGRELIGIIGQVKGDGSEDNKSLTSHLEDLDNLKTAYNHLKLDFKRIEEDLERKDLIIISLKFDLEEKTIEFSSLEEQFKRYQGTSPGLHPTPSDKMTSKKLKQSNLKDETITQLEQEIKIERRQKTSLLKRLKDLESKVNRDVLLLRKENGTLVGRVKELEIEIGLWKESHRYKPEIYNAVVIKKLQYRCCRQSHDRKALIVQKNYLEKVLLGHRTLDQSLLDVMSGGARPRPKGKNRFRSVVAVIISTYRLKMLVQIHKLNALQENGLL